MTLMQFGVALGAAVLAVVFCFGCLALWAVYRLFTEQWSEDQ